MARKFLPTASLAVAFCLGVFAQGQQPAEAEIEKTKAARRAKLIAAIEEEASQLRLPENRAFVNVKIGAVAWKTDQELAVKLFRSAVNDLIAAQQAAEASKNPSQFYDLLNSQNTRPQIISAIASCDAEFALEALHRSRPIAVERALSAGAANSKIGAVSGNQPYLAQSEINLEQRLVRMAAEQKPEKAIALMKDSVKKKLSAETLNLLQKIHQTDQAAANELANDVLSRLIAADMLKNEQPAHELLGLSNSLIAEFVKERQPEEKYIALDDSRVRKLLDKVIKLYVENGQRIGWVPVEQLEPAIKRFSPASYEPLRKIATAGHGVVEQNPELRKLMDSNPSPDVLVAAAKNFDPPVRTQIYQNAANKYSESGQYQAAVALLNDKLEGDALQNAVSSMNWYYAHYLLQKGQYDAAEAAMMEFNDSNRISALTSLATTVYNANREENRTRAAAILSRVRGLLPDRPENQNEMSQMFSLVNALTEIEPSEAFRMMESLTDELNRLMEAFAVVNTYQGGSAQRQREYVMTQGFNFGVYIDPNVVRTLAQKDPDRATSLIDSFDRREVRVMLMLTLLEGTN
jgi:hypothetical protein